MILQSLLEIWLRKIRRMLVVTSYTLAPKRKSRITGYVEPPYQGFVARCWGVLHRQLYSLSLWYCRRYGIRSVEALGFADWGPLPLGLFLKVSSRPLDVDCAATKFARSLGVPTPRILSYGFFYTDDGYPHYTLLMTRLPGVKLSEIWEDLSEEKQDRLKEELRVYLKRMRAAENPYGRQICSVLGGALWSPRLPWGKVGPCDASALRRELIQDAPESSFAQLESMELSSRTPRIVFTHGDLFPWNIMVHNDRISGIFDWETAGWLPDYWEVTTTQRMSQFYWGDVVRQLVDEDYTEELRAERLIWKCTSDLFPFM
ncbi:kinase-like protein [Atractiella rhizophila]|nr:kinase-like protein [Atractiella rhizophila]